METTFSARVPKRLGICLSTHKRSATLLAGDAAAVLRHTSFEACRSDEARFVSHIPAHLWDTTERQRRKPEGRTRTAATREPESHDGRLHAGDQSIEARGAEKFGQPGEEGRGFGNQGRLSGSNWIMKKTAILRKFFILLASPTGFEPVLPP